VDAKQFVDDLIKALRVRAHAACGGLDGNCPICLEALERTLEKIAFLDKMMKDCALEYSDKGDMRILQRHLYIGIIFDTLKGLIFIGKDKFDKTMALLLELMQQAESTPRVMSKLQGKCGHLWLGTLWLPEQYEKGAEMWPFDPRTILFNWEQGIDMI
jgi:hypothetical protein